MAVWNEADTHRLITFFLFALGVQNSVPTNPGINEHLPILLGQKRELQKLFSKCSIILSWIICIYLLRQFRPIKRYFKAIGFTKIATIYWPLILRLFADMATIVNFII